MAAAKDLRSVFAGALLATVAGLTAIQYPLFDGLDRLSYDLPAVLQRHVPREVVLVYIDSKVKSNLGEPTDLPLNRRYHIQLVDRLTRDGAKLIFYDLLFDRRCIRRGLAPAWQGSSSGRLH